jgi:hypothetical protein
MEFVAQSCLLVIGIVSLVSMYRLFCCKIMSVTLEKSSGLFSYRRQKIGRRSLSTASHSNCQLRVYFPKLAMGSFAFLLTA